MVAIDIESQGLNPREHKILGVAVYGDGYDHYMTLDQFKYSFNSVIPENSIFHNAVFDLEFLKLNGVVLPKAYHDTKLMAYLLCKASTRLKDLGEKELGETVIRYENLCGTGKKQVTLDQVDPKQADEYARQDARLTYRLFDTLKAQMSPKIWDLYFKLELPVARILLEMRLTGIKVDTLYLRELSHSVRKEIAFSLTEMRQYAHINFNSPKQVGEFMYSKLSLPVLKRTETNKPATDTEVLQQLTTYHKFPELLLSYRDASKRLGTYIEPLIEEGEKNNETVYPKFNQMVTATGRLSSSDPINLQNIPKRKKTGEAIRKGFVARKNRVFVEADYSQQEARLMAHFSRDANLLKLFNTDTDIYTAIVQQVLQVGKEEAKEKRSLGKLLFLAMSYGAQAKKLSRSAKVFHNMDIPESEMQELLDRLSIVFATYTQWRQDMIQLVHKQGYTETILGRRRYFPKIRSADKWERWAQEREAVNSIIQGSGADITKMALVKLSKAGYKILLTVHDSVLIEQCAWNQQQAEIEPSVPLHIKEIMETVVKLSIPLKVEIVVSNQWGEKEKDKKIIWTKDGMCDPEKWGK